MQPSALKSVLFILAALLIAGEVASAGNISPTDKYAWSETGGWNNLSPTHGGVTVYADHLEGFAWGERIGWIKLGSHTGGGAFTYTNSSNNTWGVNRNAGSLSGYAWSETAGWINFAPTHGGVSINPASGAFSGYAWGERIGWIHFNNLPIYTVSYLLNNNLILALHGFGTASGTSTLGQAFSCSTGSGDFTSPSYSASTLCAGSFISGDQITLTGTAAPDFNFSGWSGDYTIPSGNCLVTLSADRNVTATFSTTSTALLLNPATHAVKGYPSPAAAYTGAVGNAYSSVVIQAMATTFTGNLSLGNNVAVDFVGGFNDTFSTMNGISTIQGSLTIVNGVLSVRNLMLE